MDVEVQGFMVNLELWIFFRYTFGDSFSLLIYLRLASDKLSDYLVGNLEIKILS
jgi:hypothetical protein